MAQSDFIFDHHVVNGLYPKADAFDTSMTTDFINVSKHNKATFFIHTGVATGGTANGTVTLQASAVAAGSNLTALAFRYRVCASSTSVDTWGALTEATSTGFSMTAASNVLYEVEILSEEVEAQAAGKLFVALKVTEVTNDPVVASVLCFPSDPRYPQAVPLTAIA